MSFKKWMEYFSHWGLEPPKQSPIDPTPAAGQTNAMNVISAPGSEELPPTKLHKKKMKKK